jgi:hypothetical protein
MSFSPSRKEVTLAILFNDGKEKEITKTISLDIGKGSDAAHEVIKAIRNVETRLNAEFDGKAVLDNYISIIIKDEEKANEKLTFFLSKVLEKIRTIKNQQVADGYMNLISQVNSMKQEF